MIDPTMLAALTGIVGAILAACWSWLMASKVAAPKAAAKSKLLLVNILTGATEEDKAILEKVKGSLVRPEVERLMAAIPTMPEMPHIPTAEEIAEQMPEMPTSEEMAELIQAKIQMPNLEIDTQGIADAMFARLNQEKSAATLALQSELKAFGIPLNELAEGIMQEAQQAKTPTDIALMRLLNVDVSPKFKKQFPQLAFLVESGKVTIAQLAEIARQTGALQAAQGAGAQASAGGWNPGLR